MRNLLRAGASGVLLLLMMLGAGRVLWIGVPVAWRYSGSQVVVSIVAIVPLLGWLNRKHLELREARGLETHGATALEAVMTVSVAVAVIAFSVWFFVIAGPGPSLAPSN